MSEKNVWNQVKVMTSESQARTFGTEMELTQEVINECLKEHKKPNLAALAMFLKAQQNHRSNKKMSKMLKEAIDKITESDPDRVDG